MACPPSQRRLLTRATVRDSMCVQCPPSQGNVSTKLPSSVQPESSSAHTHHHVLPTRWETRTRIHINCNLLLCHQRDLSILPFPGRMTHDTIYATQHIKGHPTINMEEYLPHHAERSITISVSAISPTETLLPSRHHESATKVSTIVPLRWNQHIPTTACHHLKHISIHNQLCQTSTSSYAMRNPWWLSQLNHELTQGTLNNRP